MTWMQTHGGRPVSFLTPDPTTIEIEDICLHLSRIPRFNGATRVFYSVAQHSRHVMQTVRDASPGDKAAQMWALMHDFHEAFTGDRSSPLQIAERALLPSGWPEPIKVIQDRLDRVIAQRFGIDWADVEAVKPLVKRADMIALSTEKHQLMATEPQPWTDMPPPCEIELIPLCPANAEWLLRLEFDRCLAAYRVSKAPQREAAE